MTDRTIRKGIFAAGLGFGAVALVACQDQQLDFRPDHEMRSSEMVAAAQTETGARADGMLYPMHFDGNELNSLGKEKLSLMTKTGQHAQLVVYLDLPKGDPTGPARSKAVQDYLSGAGLEASAFKVEIGANPGSHSMSQPSIARLMKTESPSGGGDSGGATMSAGETK